MTNADRVITIAVDAMGGDHAPQELVAGAVAAARDGGVQIALVGDEEKVRHELSRHEADGLPISVVPSEGVIEEGEQPALALRQKPRSSILVCTGLVKKSLADATVTMGSTGAAMAASAVVLGMFDGIDRPALGGPVLGVAPHTTIIDLGTNVDCRPAQLLSFGVIGGVFASSFWGIENPRIALLSVGGEAGKGNRQVREATALFEKSGLNFVGNVEANDLPMGKVDVAVTDGFVGNIVMKLTEGLGAALSERLRQRLQGKLPESEIEELVRDVYEINNVVETHGGGPLLGVNGVCVVGHGRGKAESVRRAIGTARHSVESALVERLEVELAAVQAKVGA